MSAIYGLYNLFLQCSVVPILQEGNEVQILLKQVMSLSPWLVNFDAWADSLTFLAINQITPQLGKQLDGLPECGEEAA